MSTVYPCLCVCPPPVPVPVPQLPRAETHSVHQRSPVQLHLHQVRPHGEILCHRKCRRAGQPVGRGGAGVRSLLLQVGPPPPPTCLLIRGRFSFLFISPVYFSPSSAVSACLQAGLARPHAELQPRREDVGVGVGGSLHRHRRGGDRSVRRRQAGFIFFFNRDGNGEHKFPILSAKFSNPRAASARTRGGEWRSTNTLLLYFRRFFRYLYFTYLFFWPLCTLTPYKCPKVSGLSSSCIGKTCWLLNCSIES